MYNIIYTCQCDYQQSLVSSIFYYTDCMANLNVSQTNIRPTMYDNCFASLDFMVHLDIIIAYK